MLSLFEAPALKVGHTITSDFRFMSYTLKREFKTDSFVDLVDLYRQKCPGQKYSSLAYLCEKFL